MTNTTTKAKYLFALVGAKEGICVKKFVIKLGAVPSGLVLWRYIVRQYYQHILARGTEVSPDDQKLYKAISLENE